MKGPVKVKLPDILLFLMNARGSRSLFIVLRGSRHIVFLADWWAKLNSFLLKNLSSTAHAAADRVYASPNLARNTPANIVFIITLMRFRVEGIVDWERSGICPIRVPKVCYTRPSSNGGHGMTLIIAYVFSESVRLSVSTAVLRTSWCDYDTGGHNPICAVAGMG